MTCFSRCMGDWDISGEFFLKLRNSLEVFWKSFLKLTKLETFDVWETQHLNKEQKIVSKIKSMQKSNLSRKVFFYQSFDQHLWTILTLFMRKTENQNQKKSTCNGWIKIGVVTLIDDSFWSGRNQSEALQHLVRSKDPMAVDGEERYVEQPQHRLVNLFVVRHKHQSLKYLQNFPAQGSLLTF